MRVIKGHDLSIEIDVSPSQLSLNHLTNIIKTLSGVLSCQMFWWEMTKMLAYCEMEKNRVYNSWDGGRNWKLRNAFRGMLFRASSTQWTHDIARAIISLYAETSYNFETMSPVPWLFVNRIPEFEQLRFIRCRDVVFPLCLRQ